jgi:FKBP-type peptidyl-prolyl cis-trans isomerase
MKAQEQTFLKISIGLLVIALAVVYGQKVLDQRAGPRRVLGDTTTADTAVSNDNRKIGVIAEGEDAGTEVDMSDALLIQDLQEGTGPEVKVGDRVSIHYHGTLEDGTVFDSSVERGEPFETVIGVGQLIQGWDQGIPGMKVGSKRQLTIPPSMGYGDQAVGKIPAHSTLIFEVELLEILP